jgi:putative ABC transport system substrate-binding protein
MKRRRFITGLGAAVVWPFGARPDERIPRIGYLPPAPADADKPMYLAFEAGLREFGWIPGKTIEIESRFAGGDLARLMEQARELVDLKVDLIVTAGPGVFAAHRASDEVPVVVAAYGAIDELVALGIVASLAHPGGAVTGETFELDGLFVKRIELLRQTKPAMTSVGLLHLEKSPFNPFIPILEARVKALGLTPEPIAIADPGDCDRALSSGAGASIGGLMVSDEPQFTLGPGPAVIAAAALRHGMPTAGPAFFANSGGLMSYAVDFLPMARRAAYFVDKILKGTKPGDIPIEQATKFTTVVNLKTAKALSLEFPADILAAADEVIE